MSVQPGDTLLHYRVVERIGAGGMGEVWRALDTTLDRETAIKVLPEGVAADGERLARFEREAKLLATLNHPNIAAIYGLHETAGVRFIAMELVAGEDLATRIERGAVALDDAVEIARQVAGAVEAAHESGVIHRDLKPANVVVGDSGQVKVLDFGLAKALSPDPVSPGTDPSLSPTVTSVGSVAGVILGTAAYMSPEQAKGRAVDRRADIWSFGCMLYEMLSGRPTFDGDTISEILASVLKDEVAWNALPASTPGGVRRLLERCLDRDPSTRLRDIGEARVALAAPLDEPFAAAPAGARRRPAWFTVAAATVLGLVGLVVGWSLHRAPPESLLKLDLVDQDLAVDNAHRPALSPDGSRVAYFAQDVLRIRDLDRVVAREIPETRSARSVFWSPDGSQVAFWRGDELLRAAVDGGAPVLVARTGSLVSGGGGCWGDDGRIVYSRGHTPLYEVPALGGEPRMFVEPDHGRRENHLHMCSFLPDDRGMLFVVHPSEHPANTIALLAGGETRYLLQLADDTVHDPVWSPTGHIVFNRGGGTRNGVWALPFDLARLEVTGDPVLVVPEGAVSSVAADGSFLYAPIRADAATKLLWVFPDGTVEGTAVEFDHTLSGLDLSPDGTQIAVVVNAGGVSELWIVDPSRGTRTQLTHGPGGVSNPSWSSDGKRIAFARNNVIHVVDVSSGDPPRPIDDGLAPAFVGDNRHVIAHRVDDGGRYELWLLDSEGKEESRVLIRDPSASVRWGEVSPDGRFMLYSRGDGNNELFLTRFPEVSGRWQVATNDAGWSDWSADGKRLFYVAGLPEDAGSRWLFEVEFSGEPVVALGVPRPLFSLSEAGVGTRYEAAGDRFLMEARSRVQSVTRLVLVRNWYEEFR